MISELISAWQEGDQAAARAIFEEFRTEIFRLVFGILTNPQDAEEVTQDAFVYALNNIHQFNPDLASFRTWLHLIAVSRSRDRLRKKRIQSISLHAIFQRGVQLPSNEESPEETTANREQEDRVQRLLHSLSPRIREAVILRFWAGHTYKEMALIMGCPLPTAQSRVRIGLKQLKRTLQEAKEPPITLMEMRSK
jgi:RNA polymerase sigma-70 factor, ECF subfamily